MKFNLIFPWLLEKYVSIDLQCNPKGSLQPCGPYRTTNKVGHPDKDILNPKPGTLNPKPSTLSPKPRSVNLGYQLPALASPEGKWLGGSGGVQRFRDFRVEVSNPNPKS